MCARGGGGVEPSLLAAENLAEPQNNDETRRIS